MVLAKAQIQIEQMKAEAKKQSDTMKAQLDMMKAKTELELKRREIMLSDDRVRDKQVSDAIVKLLDIQATTGINQSAAIAKIEALHNKVGRSTQELAPRKRRVKFERDGNNRLAGATVVDEEEV